MLRITFNFNFNFKFKFFFITPYCRIILVSTPFLIYFVIALEKYLKNIYFQNLLQVQLLVLIFAQYTYFLTELYYMMNIIRAPKNHEISFPCTGHFIRIFPDSYPVCSGLKFMQFKKALCNHAKYT